MLTKNVQFSAKPEQISVRVIGSVAHIDIAQNIVESKDDNGNLTYTADVYSMETPNTKGLQDRINGDINAWIRVASETPDPRPTLQDALDGLNALTEIVLGGE